LVILYILGKLLFYFYQNLKLRTMRFLLAILLFLSVAPLVAQNNPMIEVMHLQMPEGSGARASAIAWHPVYKRYYAPKSGNASFAMAIFDEKGNLISPEGLTAKFDVRGFWYNPKLKTFGANGYNDNGWVTYKLDNNGYPVDVVHDVEWMNQPDEHSVGSYDAKNNVVYFLKGQFVVTYNAANYEEIKSTRLHINSKNQTDATNSQDEYDEAVTPENINNTTVQYTGIPKMEFALLDYKDKKIQLYDAKTGYMTKVLSLPHSAPAQDMLCFTYSNNKYWLYDMQDKSWYAYVPSN